MSIRLNLNQARELLEFFGGEDADVTVSETALNMHSGPGLYAWLTKHPEEGSIKLDEEADWEHPCSFRGEPVQTPAGESCSFCGLREAHVSGAGGTDGR